MIIRVQSGYESILDAIGLASADSVFSHLQIKVWRSIPERENATLDATLKDGRSIRLHIKRYRQSAPARNEAAGIAFLNKYSIPTVSLVAHGQTRDGRSFIITEDLQGYEPADKLIEKGLAFEAISRSVAELSAHLHNAGLHHHDLYLCHFFVRRDPLDVRLIDAARVKRLPGWPFRNRWIVKDLSQLWYSLMQLKLSERERLGVLEHYAKGRHLDDYTQLKKKIEAKAKRIARHDRNLNRKQPTRNISIPVG